MIVSRSDNAFAFSFASLDDVREYNEWLADIGLHHARVMMPSGMSSRSFKRVVTKRPSILRCDDDDAVQAVLDRWL